MEHNLQAHPVRIILRDRGEVNDIFDVQSVIDRSDDIIRKGRPSHHTERKYQGRISQDLYMVLAIWSILLRASSRI